MLSTLIKLGLSEKEAKVYLAALELARDSVQNIAKKAGVNRPTAYVILEKLMRQGLVSTLEQGKKTYFIAEDPKELLTLLEKQKREIEDKKIELKEIMNQLTALNNTRRDKPIVRYFEGADGLMALENYGSHLLKKNPETMSFTPIDLLEEFFPEKRKQAVTNRVVQKIKSKTIYTYHHPLSKAQNDKEMRDGVFIPRSEFPINTVLSIYPELGIKIFHLDKNKPYGVLIESKELAKNFKYYFGLAWLGAKSKNSSKK